MIIWQPFSFDTGDAHADPTQTPVDRDIPGGMEVFPPNSSNSDQNLENDVHQTYTCLPPTYSSIDIPEVTNCDPDFSNDLPPAYAENP